MSLMAILLGMGAPSFMTSIRENRNLTAANVMLSAVSSARSEAVRRGATVTLCPSINGTTCSSNWADGWLVLLDNASGVSVPSVNKVLQVGTALNDTLTTQIPAGTPWIRFSPRGIADGIAAGATLKINLKPSTCPAGTTFRIMEVTSIGRVSFTKSTC
jgi:type IV fimbrial biogenesis protein FimT